MKINPFEEKEFLRKELVTTNSDLIKSFLLQNYYFNTFKVSTNWYIEDPLTIHINEYSLYLDLPSNNWNEDLIILIDSIINNKVNYFETLRLKELERIEYKLNNINEFIEELKEKEKRIQELFIKLEINWSKRDRHHYGIVESFVVEKLKELKALLNREDKKLLKQINDDFLNFWDKYSFYLDYVSLWNKKMSKLLEGEGALEDYLFNKIEKEGIRFSKFILELDKYDSKYFKEIPFNLKEKNSSIIKIEGAWPVDEFNTISYSLNGININYENLFKGLKDIFKERLSSLLWKSIEDKKYLFNIEIWFELS